MILEDLIAIKAQNYEEEQYLLTKFPNAYWFLKEGDDFHTFLLSRKWVNSAVKVVTEWTAKQVKESGD
jgi:hypothetical protein